MAVFLANHPLHGLYGGENAFLLQEYLSAIRDAGITLTSVLNPNQSDINLYPNNLDKLKNGIANRLRLPKILIPNIAIGWLGELDRTPGRLYTFVGRKP